LGWRNGLFVPEAYSNGGTILARPIPLIRSCTVKRAPMDGDRVPTDASFSMT
jgi:hypothetical protein